jgi:hypothetical protein
MIVLTVKIPQNWGNVSTLTGITEPHEVHPFREGNAAIIGLPIFLTSSLIE